MGRGWNLLVRDGGIRGVVIHPTGGVFSEFSVDGPGHVTAGAGVRLKKLASAAGTAGIGGFEWMEGIPGNLGGCLRMNAGAMGAQTFDQVVSVRFINGNGDVQEKWKDEIKHAYRSVPEFDQHYAVSAVLQGTPANTADIDAKPWPSTMRTSSKATRQVSSRSEANQPSTATLQASAPSYDQTPQVSNTLTSGSYTCMKLSTFRASTADLEGSRARRHCL